MSSRLFLKLREEMGLAYEVSSFFPTRLQSSEWVIYLGLPKERLTVAAKKLSDILRDLVRRGVNAAEVRQAKQMIKGSYIMEHQLRRRQAWYGAWWEFLGREPGYDRRFFKEVDRVTLKAVQTVAEELLAQPRVTVEVVPR